MRFHPSQKSRLNPFQIHFQVRFHPSQDSLSVGLRDYSQADFTSLDLSDYSQVDFSECVQVLFEGQRREFDTARELTAKVTLLQVSCPVTVHPLA